MYERFTDQGRKAMQLANQEAQRLCHDYIGTEHILLGLVKEGSGAAAKVLAHFKIDLRKIQLEIEKIIQRGPDMISFGRMPMMPRAKKIVEYAICESRDLGHSYVGTEHLLLGILREQEGVTAQVLKSFGMTIEKAREKVVASISEMAILKIPEQKIVTVEVADDGYLIRGENRKPMDAERFYEALLILERGCELCDILVRVKKKK